MARASVSGNEPTVRKRTDCSEMNRLFDNGQYFFMEMSWNQ